MNLVALSLFRPQRLLLTLHVITDHRIGRIQDGLRGTVILLQLDNLRLRKHLFKIPGYC